MFLSMAEFRAFKNGAKTAPGGAAIMLGENRPREISDTAPAMAATTAMQRQRAVPATVNSSVVVPPMTPWDAYMVSRNSVPFKRGL